MGVGVARLVAYVFVCFPFGFKFFQVDLSPMGTQLYLHAVGRFVGGGVLPSHLSFTYLGEPRSSAALLEREIEILNTQRLVLFVVSPSKYQCEVNPKCTAARINKQTNI